MLKHEYYSALSTNTTVYLLESTWCCIGFSVLTLAPLCAYSTATCTVCTSTLKDCIHHCIHVLRIRLQLQHKSLILHNYTVASAGCTGSVVLTQTHPAALTCVELVTSP